MKNQVFKLSFEKYNIYLGEDFKLETFDLFPFNTSTINLILQNKYQEVTNLLLVGTVRQAPVEIYPFVGGSETLLMDKNIFLDILWSLGGGTSHMGPC